MTHNVIIYVFLCVHRYIPQELERQLADLDAQSSTAGALFQRLGFICYQEHVLDSLSQQSLANCADWNPRSMASINNINFVFQSPSIPLPILSSDQIDPLRQSPWKSCWMRILDQWSLGCFSWPWLGSSMVSDMLVSESLGGALDCQRLDKVWFWMSTSIF